VRCSCHKCSKIRWKIGSPVTKPFVSPISLLWNILSSSAVCLAIANWHEMLLGSTGHRSESREWVCILYESEVYQTHDTTACITRCKMTMCLMQIWICQVCAREVCTRWWSYDKETIILGARDRLRCVCEMHPTLEAFKFAQRLTVSDLKLCIYYIYGWIWYLSDLKICNTI